MPYLKTRDIAAISIGAALWGVLNGLFSPIIFNLTGLPILCDLVGFTILTLAAWWIRKLGALTVIGFVATLITFAVNPSGGLIFLGFTAASVVFDVAAKVLGYDKSFKKTTYTMITALALSTSSAAVAGFIIGSFFMPLPVLTAWGGVVGWMGLHATGGVIGGLLGGLLVNMLIARKVFPKEK